MQRDKKILILVAVAFLAVGFLMQGCTQNLNIKPVSDMTPLEKATLAMATYNRIADGYKAKVALPDLSAAEKKVLNQEYALMEKSWPAIDAYYKAVKGGTPITTEIIKQIDQFLITYRY